MENSNRIPRVCQLGTIVLYKTLFTVGSHLEISLDAEWCGAPDCVGKVAGNELNSDCAKFDAPFFKNVRKTIFIKRSSRVSFSAWRNGEKKKISGYARVVCCWFLITGCKVKKRVKGS